MDGALMEIGPYRVGDGGRLSYNNGSWDEFANVLFVDNPVGTGFSYVNTDSYLHELDEMTDQFIVFLEKWFALFPEYEHDDVSTYSSAQPRPTVDHVLIHHSYTSQVNHTPASIFRTSLEASSTVIKTRVIINGI